MRKFLIALCLTVGATTAFAETNVNTPIAKETTTIEGQKIEVVKNPTVLVSSSIFAPGAKTPVHKHLYAHYVYVLEGTLTIVNVESGKSYDIAAGHFFVEMRDIWHYGINKGTVPVRTLVVDQVPAGVTENRVLKDAAEPMAKP
jgi:quercetin dioxygenase-like cupin family protein